jgi:hypothetical protein
MAEWILAISAALGILAAISRFIYRGVRNNQITHVFVKSIATNHLPHIQTSLEKIADRLSVEIPPAPPIEFVDLGEK